MPRPSAAILIVALAAAGCEDPSTSLGPPQVRIGRAVFNVELALDNDTRAKGLGGRTTLAENAGMLFAFSREEVLRFHMLDCHIPLDVAFIGEDLVIVEIRTMRVEPDPTDPKALYSSAHPARYALEVPGGVLERLGVRSGDSVQLLGAARNAAKDAR